MADQNIFKRYEMKYLITKTMQQKILESTENHLRADEHGKSTICNLYFDTPDFLLIRRSIEKPVYKEKMRIRSYGVARDGSPVFAELKKKYKSVVYKRRITFPYGGTPELSADNAQIAKEINYFFRYYGSLEPRVFLSYERAAYYDVQDGNFRVTFDENILWRDYDLSLSSGVYGEPVLAPDTVLMEVKASEAIPLWFTRILSDNRIYKTSFSKYGTAYKNMIKGDGQKDVSTF